MDKLKEQIKKGRNMKDRSLEAYMRNISKLSKGVTDKEFKSLAFSCEPKYAEYLESTSDY